MTSEPKAPMGVEEAKGAIGALVHKYGDNSDYEAWQDLLAALAQPKEGQGGHTAVADGHGLAPDVAARFSDEVVERMARAYDNASSGSAYWDTFDASPGSQTWAKWRDERLAAMRAALATLETKEKAGLGIPSGPENRCTHVLRAQGLPYPRTCQVCRLGPCPFKDKYAPIAETK